MIEWHQSYGMIKPVKFWEAFAAPYWSGAAFVLGLRDAVTDAEIAQVKAQKIAYREKTLGKPLEKAQPKPVSPKRRGKL